MQIVGGEPVAGSDVQLSLQQDQIVHIEVPETIADGQQTTSPGIHTFEIMRRHVRIATVTDTRCLKLWIGDDQKQDGAQWTSLCLLWVKFNRWTARWSHSLWRQYFTSGLLIYFNKELSNRAVQLTSQRPCLIGVVNFFVVQFGIDDPWRKFPPLQGVFSITRDQAASPTFRDSFMSASSNGTKCGRSLGTHKRRFLLLGEGLRYSRSCLDQGRSAYNRCFVNATGKT